MEQDWACWNRMFMAHWEKKRFLFDFSAKALIPSLLTIFYRIVQSVSGLLFPHKVSFMDMAE